MHLEDELKQLQHRLALVDLLTERRARPYENMTEFLVVRLGDLLPENWSTRNESRLG
jgi:hypothetical protein